MKCDPGTNAPACAYLSQLPQVLKPQLAVYLHPDPTIALRSQSAERSKRVPSTLRNKVDKTNGKDNPTRALLLARPRHGQRRGNPHGVVHGHKHSTPLRPLSYIEKKNTGQMCD